MIKCYKRNYFFYEPRDIITNNIIIIDESGELQTDKLAYLIKRGRSIFEEIDKEEYSLKVSYAAGNFEYRIRKRTKCDKLTAELQDIKEYFIDLFERMQERWSH